MTSAGFKHTFRGFVGDFSSHNRNQHGGESTLYCSACHELPDDPILTSCLHFYCTECFTELLVNARGANGRCSGVVACQADSCNGFQIAHGYRQLTDCQFKRIAESVGVTIVEEAATLSGNLPSSRFDDMSGDGGVFDNAPDDVAALWRSIDPDMDRSLPQSVRSPFAGMVDAADRVGQENEDKDEWTFHFGRATNDRVFYEDWEPDEWRFGAREVEEGWDQYRDDRSQGYRTEDGDTDDEDESQDKDEDDDEDSEHPFVAADDAPIDRGGCYILDSDSDIRASESSDDDSDSDDSDISDVSATEARQLKKDWPSAWRQGIRRAPQLSLDQQQRLRLAGWSCHGMS